MSNEDILDKHYPKERSVFRDGILKAMDEACQEEVRYRLDEAASSLLSARQEARRILEEQTNTRLQTLDEINQRGLLQLERIDKILARLERMLLLASANDHYLPAVLSISPCGTVPSLTPGTHPTGPPTAIAKIPSYNGLISESPSFLGNDS